MNNNDENLLAKKICEHLNKEEKFPTHIRDKLYRARINALNNLDASYQLNNSNSGVASQILLIGKSRKFAQLALIVIMACTVSWFAWEKNHNDEISIENDVATLLGDADTEIDFTPPTPQHEEDTAISTSNTL